MSKLIIERRYYSGESVETSEFYAVMISEFDVPPVLSVGMKISIGGQLLVLDEIRWNAPGSVYVCNAAPSFVDWRDRHDLDELIKDLCGEEGWRLCFRDKNPDQKLPLDVKPEYKEEEKEWFECERIYSRLSESEKIDFHRRIDRAEVVEGIALSQWKRVNELKAEYKIKNNQKVVAIKWFVLFCVLYSVLLLVLPEFRPGFGWELFSSYMVAAMIMGYISDLENNRTGREIKDLEESRRASFHEFEVLTGAWLSSTHLDSVLESHTNPDINNDAHRRRVVQGVLSKLRQVRDFDAVRNRRWF